MNSKVTPFNLNVPKTKQNNFFDKGENIVRRLKIIIFIQVVTGINRLFLLNYNTFQKSLGYFHSSFMFFCTLYCMIMPENIGNHFVILKTIAGTEYLILVFISAFTYKETQVKFFKHLAEVDLMLNISRNTKDTVRVTKAVIWMASSFIYCVVEFIILYYILNFGYIYSALTIYFAVFAHDSEQIFFVTLLQTVMIRVRILKAHIAKTFGTDKDGDIKEEYEAIDNLANKVELDTTAMHRAYELLYTCAEELNSAMSMPTIIMMFTSGLSTIMLLKNFFQLTQMTTSDTMEFKIMAIYSAVRCFKYTLLVVLPCYYASVTSRQVVNIRSMLHNTINTFKLEKIERRKVKAFFQLTQDNEFTYALWGVIRLSMSLPLSYASLCTTYLVITIQFSKFLD